jgi:hypothetical protein
VGNRKRHRRETLELYAHLHNSQFFGEPPDEQITANAPVTKRNRSIASACYAVYSGTLGSNFGQILKHGNDALPQDAAAA